MHARRLRFRNATMPPGSCARVPTRFPRHSARFSLGSLSLILREMLMGERMHAVRAQLDAGGLALHLPTDERNSAQGIATDAGTATTAPPLDVTFADDGAIIVIVPASDLYPATCRALAAVAD
eukprot:3400413-Pyramimonas_sp.AAC.1